MSAQARKDTSPRICSKCGMRLRYRLIDGEYVEVTHICPVERRQPAGSAP